MKVLLIMATARHMRAVSIRYDVLIARCDEDRLSSWKVSILDCWCDSGPCQHTQVLAECTENVPRATM